ncbi:hypothetical protein LCGC14_2785810, partial [marine sediment metagenome]
LTEEDMDKVKRDKKLARRTSIKGPLVLLKKRILWEDIKYVIRGFMYVDGDKILDRSPPKDWKWDSFVVPSDPKGKVTLKSLNEFV